MRKSGVLMHITSLPGEYSIGSLGEPARQFIDKLAEAGFSLWQVLPLSMTDEVGSPYKSAASFGANPYLIDLPKLYEEGLLTAEELRSAAQDGGGRVEFSRIFRDRLELLRLAASRVVDRSEIIAYVDARPELSRAAYFLALKDVNGGKEWQRWDNFDCPIDELFFRQFIEYKFYTQWQELHDYARARGISIIGDMPIYVAADSADVWGEPSQFMLDPDGYPTSVAGVPPDYFSAEGQLWGNPLYNWAQMKRDGYAWWRRRLEHALTMYDGVRIDHFRAIEAYFAVPKSAASAKEGGWQKGPGRAFIRMIREVADGRTIIAEDLGDITDEVRRLVDYSGFPGMRVLQFGFLGDNDSIHLAHNIPPHCVAYTGTHDNNTIVGFAEELDEGRRVRFLDYIGAKSAEPRDVADAAIRTLMASRAEWVIFPVQDLLAEGGEARMNIPGSPEGNWGYRMSLDALRAFPTARLRYLNELYGR